MKIYTNLRNTHFLAGGFVDVVGGGVAVVLVTFGLVEEWILFLNILNIRSLTMMICPVVSLQRTSC